MLNLTYYLKTVLGINVYFKIFNCNTQNSNIVSFLRLFNSIYFVSVLVTLTTDTGKLLAKLTKVLD